MSYGDPVSVIRPLVPEDAAEIAALFVRNRSFLAPYEPPREESFYTVPGQRRLIEDLVAMREAGTNLPMAILDGDGAVAGRLNLNNIVRGPFLSCSLGYWVGEQANGRGLASRAAAEAVRIAFEELGLHRVEAGTLVDNVASQRVLAKNGFERFGLAPRYLRIDGAWRDHVLFQRINDDHAWA